jgi:hypothetical protein
MFNQKLACQYPDKCTLSEARKPMTSIKAERINGGCYSVFISTDSRQNTPVFSLQESAALSSYNFMISIEKVISRSTSFLEHPIRSGNVCEEAAQ